MNSKSFTIVEILVVMGMIGLMIPVIFTIMFAVVRQQARVLALTQVKTQGDFILENMKVIIKNNAISVHNGTPASSVNQVCVTPSSNPVTYNPLYLLDKYGNTLYYSVIGGQVASNSSILNASSTLSTGRVSISSFTVKCNRTSIYSTPIVSISYTVNYVTASGESPASLSYSSKIKLRNR